LYESTHGDSTKLQSILVPEIVLKKKNSVPEQIRGLMYAACVRLLWSAIEFSLSHLSGGEITTLRTRDEEPAGQTYYFIFHIISRE